MKPEIFLNINPIKYKITNMVFQWCKLISQPFYSRHREAVRICLRLGRRDGEVIRLGPVRHTVRIPEDGRTQPAVDSILTQQQIRGIYHLTHSAL